MRCLKKVIVFILVQPSIASYIHRQLIKFLPQNGISVRHLIYQKLYNLIKENHELLVKAKIANSELVVTFSHSLPFILKKYPSYSSNIVRIAKLVKSKYHDLSFIDIGANIGDTVALLRDQTYFPIFCIEGSNFFFAILEMNIKQYKDVTIVRTFLGETNNEISSKFSIENGTGRLGFQEGNVELVQVATLSTVLKETPFFANSKLVKIDTDGFDSKILKGAKDFLLNVKPIVFFEFDPAYLEEQEEEPLSIFNFLQICGYDNLLIYDNLGDLVLSTKTSDKILLEEIYFYFSGRKNEKYFDICAFTPEDNDLFLQIREGEIAFSKNR